MNIFEFILEKITDYLPGRKITGFENEPYLERYYLFSLFGVTAYIHRFVDSDPDRGLHDHPWWWSCSFILIGYYNELFLSDHNFKTRERRWFNFIPGYRFHRVLIGNRKPVWTLFVHGRRVKLWGFMRNQEHNGINLLNYEYHIYQASPNPGWHKISQKGKQVKVYRK